MKHIPYEKLQKRRKKEVDKRKRRDFGALNPVTRVPDKPNAYKRKKARVRDDHGGFFCLRTYMTFYPELYIKQTATC